jgi:Tol biopolymer transport system component
MRCPAVVILAVASLLAGCGGTSPPRHTGPVARTSPAPSISGHLVYKDAVAGHAQLFVVGADGSALQQLTHLSGDQLSPAWSPDGSKIVFERDFADRAGVYITNADGTHVRRLSPDDAAGRYAAEPAFSPDGRWVVFGRQIGERTNGIALMPAAGGRVRTVTHNLEFTHLGGGKCGCDGGPRFTPDGRQIVFKRIRKNETASAIFIVDRSGRGLHRLTEWKLSASQPRVSRDGKRLAYSVNGEDNGIANVFVKDLQGNDHVTQLTHQTSGGGTGLNGWSPDGHYLSITTDRANGHAQIWVMRADGSQPHSITPHAHDAHQADWGP